MICQPCKDQEHKACPGEKDIPMAVAMRNCDDPVLIDNERVHRQSQCACQHRAR